jgi:hypothetical protein
MPPRKPKSPRSRKIPLDRLRIHLKGHHTTAELRAMLNEAVDKIEAMAITHFGTRLIGSDLYIKLSDHRGDALTNLGPYAEIMKDEITISEPYRSAADEHPV